MRQHELEVDVLGPWSLATSRAFWEGFGPAALSGQNDDEALGTVFRVEADWSRAEARVTQHGSTAQIQVTGPGDLGAAAQQVARFLSLDVDAALDGRLDGTALRARDPEDAVRSVQQIKGLGPFAAELVVLRGANAPDVLPGHERCLDAEIVERYGPDRTLPEVTEAWRPYRTWAAVHLRALREQRTHEIS